MLLFNYWNVCNFAPELNNLFIKSLVGCRKNFIPIYFDSRLRRKGVAVMSRPYI